MCYLLLAPMHFVRPPCLVRITWSYVSHESPMHKKSLYFILLFYIGETGAKLWSNKQKMPVVSGLSKDGKVIAICWLILNFIFPWCIYRTMVLKRLNKDLWHQQFKTYFPKIINILQIHNRNKCVETLLLWTEHSLSMCIWLYQSYVSL